MWGSKLCELWGNYSQLDAARPGYMHYGPWLKFKPSVALDVFALLQSLM
jgi:hypothetical protein